MRNNLPPDTPSPSHLLGLFLFLAMVGGWGPIAPETKHHLSRRGNLPPGLERMLLGQMVANALDGGGLMGTIGPQPPVAAHTRRDSLS